MLLIGLVAPLIAFVLESYPRWVSRNVGVDIWTHLLYLKEYHKKGSLPGYISKGFIVGGEYDYPPVFITILSKFPFKLVRKYEFLFSPIFDSIHILIIFILSYYLTGSIIFALVTQALYILTPIIIVENSSATPRSLGYTLLTITLISLFFFQDSSNYFLFLLALTSGTLIFLSHRFTTQGYLLFTIIFTVTTKDLIFLYAFFTSFLLAIILSKGFYIKVLKGHIGNLKFWRQVIKYRFAHQVRGNEKKHPSADIVIKLYQQFLKFPPFVLSITNPWLIPAIVLLFIFPLDTMTQRFYEWTIASFAMALITIWLEKFRFLGEGQRYLELSAFPTSFLATTFLFQTYSIYGTYITLAYIIIGMLSLLTILTIQRKAIINKSIRTLTPELKNMFKYIKSKKIKPRIMCIPHQITTNTIYHTGAEVLVNANYKDISKISDIYPYIKKPISELKTKYKLSHVLINENYVSMSELKIHKNIVEKEFGEFKLIKL